MNNLIASALVVAAFVSPAQAQIKLDAEGHEQQIIEGMKNVLKKCSPIILIEVNNKFLSSLNLIKTLLTN